MFLDKTDEELSKRKEAINKSGNTVHEILSLASVVQNESLFEKDRAKIGCRLGRLDLNKKESAYLSLIHHS